MTEYDKTESKLIKLLQNMFKMYQNMIQIHQSITKINKNMIKSHENMTENQQNMLHIFKNSSKPELPDLIRGSNSLCLKTSVESFADNVIENRSDRTGKSFIYITNKREAKTLP